MGVVEADTVVIWVVGTQNVLFAAATCITRVAGLSWNCVAAVHSSLLLVGGHEGGEELLTPAVHSCCLLASAIERTCSSFCCSMTPCRRLPWIRQVQLCHKMMLWCRALHHAHC